MFTAQQRQDVANRLLRAAEESEELIAGAVVGAAAAGALDALTGIDLMFAAAPDLTIGEVRDIWGERMYREFDAIHHTGDDAGIVYLLPDLLTARTAIVPAARFGPRQGEPFHQVFGQVVPQARLASGRRTSSDRRGWPRCTRAPRCFAVTAPPPHALSATCARP